jgi:hypothetical protein
MPSRRNAPDVMFRLMLCGLPGFGPASAVHFYQLALFRKPYSDQRRGNGLRTCEMAHRIKPSCFFRVAGRPAVGTESHD